MALEGISPVQIEEILQLIAVQRRRACCHATNDKSPCSSSTTARSFPRDRRSKTRDPFREYLTRWLPGPGRPHAITQISPSRTRHGRHPALGGFFDEKTLAPLAQRIQETLRCPHGTSAHKYLSGEHRGG
jgi:hypothetical protein